MTCIVGWKGLNGVCMGGDSLSINQNLETVSLRDEKVFKNGNLLIGFSSSFRMGQLLKYHLKVPEFRTGTSVEEYMCTDFIDTVRECFAENGFEGRTGEPSRDGGFFLVAIRGELFIVEDDFHVGIPREDFACLGCGEIYAYGACYILKDMDIPIEDKVKKALEAAANFSGGVSPPFVIKSLENGFMP